MIKDLNIDEIKKLLDKIDENKDLVAKEISSDIKVITWISYGLGLIFEEKSPKEMFEYMENPDLNYLKQRIREATVDFLDFSGRGYSLDLLFTIFNEDFNPLYYLDIEHQVFYSENEIRNRSLTYMSTIFFKLGNFYKTRKFSESKEVFSAWILPDVPNLKNIIQTHKFEDIFTVDNAKSSDLNSEEYKGNVDKLTAFFFFLGNPDEIDFSDDLDEEVIKRRITLYLLDSLYSLTIPPKIKLNYLKPFSLTQSKVETEVKLMQDLLESIENGTFEFMGRTRNSIDQMEVENEKLKNEITKLKSKYNQSQNEIKTLRDQNNNSHNEIKILRDEIFKTNQNFKALINRFKRFQEEGQIPKELNLDFE